MHYPRENLSDAIVFLLVVVMAYLSGRVVFNDPGMSVSGWLFMVAPVAAVGAVIALITISSNSGLGLSAFFGFSPVDVDKRVLLLFSILAIALGASIVFNPFDFIVPVFVGAIILLFLRSVLMVVMQRPIDAIGTVLTALPLITYAEFEITRKSGFDSGWITIKTAVILFFAMIWFAGNFLTYKKELPRGKFNFIVSLFVFITFLSAVLSAEIAYSLKRWLFEIIYPLLFYFMVVNSIRRAADVKKFLSYLIGSVFLNLSLVFYYFAKYGAGNIDLEEHSLNLNFADGVLIANVLILIIPVVIAFLAAEQKISRKLIFFALIMMALIGLALSFARMAQVSIVIGLFLFGAAKKTRKYLLMVAALCLLFYVISPERFAPYLSKYETLTSFEDIVDASSMEKRYEGWNGALNMFRDHPLTGVGIGRYSQEYVHYGELYSFAWSSGVVPLISAHNIYLNYLAETGIFGISLLLTILIFVMAKGVRLIMKGGRDLVLKYSLLISVIIFSLNNLVDGITFAYVKEIDKGIVFWSITAMIMSYSEMENYQRRGRSGRRDRLRIGANNA